MAGHQATCERGLVDVDESFFLETFNGQRQLPRLHRQRGGHNATRGRGKDQILVMVVRDREDHAADFKLDKLGAQHVQVALQRLIDPEAMLYTDGAAVYCPFAR